MKIRYVIAEYDIGIMEHLKKVGLHSGFSPLEFDPLKHIEGESRHRGRQEDHVWRAE